MIRFSEMPYERPDMEALKQAIEEAARCVREAKSYAEAPSSCGPTSVGNTASACWCSAATARFSCDGHEARGYQSSTPPSPSCIPIFSKGWDSLMMQGRFM